MIAYGIGIAVQVPFMNTTWWKGWAVDSLSGADLAWIIGLPVSALSYYLLARREVVASDEVAVSVPVSAEPTAAP
jgi:purine-cytosine permease-like protein